MLKILATATLISTLTGCIFAVGTGSDDFDHNVDCTVSVADSGELHINGSCPSNLRLNVANDSKKINIETETASESN